MRVVCAKKESALGFRGAIPGSEALGRKGLAGLASEKEPGAGVCRLLEVESEGGRFGEPVTPSAIGEADRRGGTRWSASCSGRRGGRTSRRRALEPPRLAGRPRR